MKNESKQPELMARLISLLPLEEVFRMMSSTHSTRILQILRSSSCFSPSIHQLLFISPTVWPLLHPTPHHPTIFQAEGSGLPRPELPMPQEPGHLDDWGRGIHGESMVNRWHVVKWKGGSPKSWMVYKGKCHSNEDDVPGVPLFYVFTCVQHVLQCRESYHLKSQSFFCIEDRPHSESSMLVTSFG